MLLTARPRSRNSGCVKFSSKRDVPCGFGIRNVELLSWKPPRWTISRLPPFRVFLRTPRDEESVSSRNRSEASPVVSALPTGSFVLANFASMNASESKSASATTTSFCRIRGWVRIP